MNIKRYRLFVTLSWIVGVLYVIVSILSEQFYPEPLRVYLESTENKPWTNSDTVFLIYGSALLLSMLISYVGLYGFKEYSRKLFLLTHILGYAPIDLTPSIGSFWSDSLLTITYLLTGIVIGASFFDGEIVKKFKADPDATGQRR